MTISEFHPCYMCVEPKRHIGCHSDCKEYGDFTAERKRLADEAHRRNAVGNMKASKSYETTTRYYRGNRQKDIRFNEYGKYYG